MLASDAQITSIAASSEGMTGVHNQLTMIYIAGLACVSLSGGRLTGTGYSHRRSNMFQFSCASRVQSLANLAYTRRLLARLVLHIGMDRTGILDTFKMQYNTTHSIQLNLCEDALTSWRLSIHHRCKRPPIPVWLSQLGERASVYSYPINKSQ